MSAPNQIAAQIRFQLDQLSARNGHHEFEHLCRYLARRRICSNILPSTGPVSAGGDQGRDFETFRTYLANSLREQSHFLGLASSDPIAFACTLTQTKDLGAKIKSDVTTITSGGCKIHEVHYFAAADLPVSKRHKLQDWAQNQEGIHLEIYDGQAISELLAEPDLFWIATEYLGIPSEIFPKPEVELEESWYQEIRSRWLDSEREPTSFADFTEIQSATRFATWEDSVKSDLPFWIDLLQELAGAKRWTHLTRKCRYEIFVASLRGLGTLDGFNDEVTDFFADIQQLSRPADLEDAAVYWTYCAAAQARNLLTVPKERLDIWRHSLVEKVSAELESSESPGKKCMLLKTLGYLELTKDAGGTNEPRTDEAVATWLKMIKIAKHAPLFPLDSFAESLTEMVVMCDGPDFDSLVQQTDTLLSDRYGKFSAAEKCYDRAKALRLSGQLIRAVKELHQAKTNWFAREALQYSILSILLLSEIYSELGLGFAAKYYALAATYAALHAERDDIKVLAPKALTHAASYAYLQGSWCGFFDLTRLALALLEEFGYKRKTAESTDSEVDTAAFHSFMIRRITTRSGKTTEYVEKRLQQIGLANILTEFEETNRDPWNGKEFDDIWETIQEQLLGPPFSDAGSESEVRFSALGVDWKFFWSNTFQMSIMAEEFLAIIQILLADLAGVDLCLLRTSVIVHLQQSHDLHIETNPMPSNEQTSWEVNLPANDGRTSSIDMPAEVLASVTVILRSASLLSDRQLMDILEDRFRSGLTDKILSIESYRKIFKSFISDAYFNLFPERFGNKLSFDRAFSTRTHPQLAWVAGPIPGHSKERLEVELQRRYENSVPPIRLTLKRLLADEVFLNDLDQLREEGWLDWHILLAVMNVVVNFRVSASFTEGDSFTSSHASLKHLVAEEESIDSIKVPLSEFSIDKLKRSLQHSMLSTIKNLNLELPHITPDFGAIEDFLGARYGYWSSDVEHPNLNEMVQRTGESDDPPQ